MLLASGAFALHAQVVPAATARQVSITAGGMASIFQPAFAGAFTSSDNPTPIPQASPQPLFGIGAYVDVKLSRWVQLEAEGRWQRFNEYYSVYQDNYLVGHRLPVYRIKRATVYAKALVGFSEMNFGTYYYGQPAGHGRFTDLAFGGGVDIKMTHRLSIRALDAEYQYYPDWGNTTLSPYGASVGIGYRIF